MRVVIINHLTILKWQLTQPYPVERFGDRPGKSVLRAVTTVPCASRTGKSYSFATRSMVKYPVHVLCDTNNSEKSLACDKNKTIRSNIQHIKRILYYTLIGTRSIRTSLTMAEQCVVCLRYKRLCSSFMFLNGLWIRLLRSTMAFTSSKSRRVR